MKIYVAASRLQVAVFGHMNERAPCGAVTMLMRAAGMVAVRLHGEPGLSTLQFKEDCEIDFYALVYGLE